MPNSIPVPLQAVVWPLIGAAAILALGRFLPAWLGRLGALVTSSVSLVALWSLVTRPAARFELSWTPLSYFRMGPVLYPTSLGLAAGITLALFTAAAVLGIRASRSQKATWHALMLVALAGCLIMFLAANVLTLALGSGLVDLAFMGMAISAAGTVGQGRRVVWRMCVPGVASTLMLILAALRMDATLGTASLLARAFPPQVLTFIGLGGLLRLMVFPAVPMRVDAAEHAAALVLSAGAGIYLLARLQTMAPAVAGSRPAWFLVLGAVALLAGGWMAWTAKVRAARWELTDFWTSAIIHQTGFALIFVILLGAAMPWPLISLPLALGILAIWWDGQIEGPAAQRSERLERIRQSLGPHTAQARSWIERRFTRVRLPARTARFGSWLARRGVCLVPGIALASLIGAPLTVGAVARWHLYGTLLSQGKAIVLLVVLLADILLAAGMWSALRPIVRQAAKRRPSIAGLLAMLVLAAAAILLGLAPKLLTRKLGLGPALASGVSVWGLGMIFVLPWLLGIWLSRIPSFLGARIQQAQSRADLELLSRVAGWAGQRLLSAIHWLGSVGEGEGWWGWALIILALGALYWTIH